MIAAPSPENQPTPPRRPGLRRDIAWLLTGLALGTAAVFASQPARAGTQGHVTAIIDHLSSRSE